MDSNEKRYFDALLREYEKEVLRKIQEDVKKLYSQAIDETVYQAYSPTTYERTYQLKDRVSCKLEGNKLIVYTDIDNMEYTSAVDGRDVTSAVPYFVLGGHSDDTGIDNMYHNYPGRNFLQRSKELIKQKYPELEIVIINDTPPIV